MRVRHACIVGLCAVLAASVFAAPPATNELTRLQSLYTSGVVRIDAKYAAMRTNAPAQYMQELDLLEKAYQQKGDFKALMAVREDRKSVV